MTIKTTYRDHEIKVIRTKPVRNVDVLGQHVLNGALSVINPKIEDTDIYDNFFYGIGRTEEAAQEDAIDQAKEFVDKNCS